MRGTAISTVAIEQAINDTHSNEERKWAIPITSGCVAKTGGSLVKVAFVVTAPRHRHPIHEPQATILFGVTFNPTSSSCVFGGTSAIR